MYNSYANRTAPGEQIPTGVLQQVMRADQPQGQLTQPATAGYGYGSHSASYSRNLQQVMQADRQAQMGGAQQIASAPQYGAIAPSYGAHYVGVAQQRGQGYGQGVNPSALNSVMQADHVDSAGSSYASYNAANSYQTPSNYGTSQMQRPSAYGSVVQPFSQGQNPSANLQQVMQADQRPQIQGQYSPSSSYTSAYPSGYAYGGSMQTQYQQGSTQQVPVQQVQPSPGLSQVMQADHTNYATGPSRSNYNY